MGPLRNVYCALTGEGKLDEPKKKGGCRRWGCGFGVLILIGSAIATVWWDIPWAAMAYGGAVNRARKLGYPLDQKMLSGGQAIPDEQNAAVLLQDAGDRQNNILEGAPGRPPEGQLSFGEIAEEMDKILLDNGDPRKALALAESAQPSLDLYVKASRQPFYGPERDFDRNSADGFELFSTVRSMTKLMASRAEARARIGDTDGAISDLVACRQVAEKMSGDSTVIGRLVSIALDAVAMKRAEWVASAWKNDPDRLKELRQKVYEANWTNLDIRPNLRGEMYMAMAVLRNAERHGGVWKIIDTDMDFSVDEAEARRREAIPVRYSGAPEGWVAKAFATRVLETWSEAIQSPEWEKGDPLEIDRLLNRLGEENSYEKTRKVSYRAISETMPVFGQVGRATVKGEAMRRVGAAYCAVLEHKAATGSWPEGLESLPIVNEDPLTDNKPLHYRRTPKGFVVYSVGINGKDDGGTDPWNDIVAEFPIQVAPRGRGGSAGGAMPRPLPPVEPK